MSKKEKGIIIAKVVLLIGLTLCVGFVWVQIFPGGIIVGDDSWAIYFEHKYSELRLKETPIYGNPALGDSVMALKLENLSYNRLYLLFQEYKYDPGFWIEFNHTTEELLWFSHHNRGFDLLVWENYTGFFGTEKAWCWVISFDVIKK